jgi:hypothetical protein
VASIGTPAAGSVGILNQEGDLVGHRQMKASPDAWLQGLAPDRAAIVGAVEGLCTWSWRAALCAHEGMPVVLGQALSLQAMHGGQAPHDPLAAHPRAGLLCGGMRPHADGAPAARRATRARWQRRRSRRRPRAALLTPVHPPHRQATRPDIGTTIADPANRAGGAARVPDPAGQPRIAVARGRLGASDRLLTARARVSPPPRRPMPRSSTACARARGVARASPGGGWTNARTSIACPEGRRSSPLAGW